MVKRCSVTLMVLCALFVAANGQKTATKPPTSKKAHAKAAVQPTCSRNGLTGAEIAELVADHNKARNAEGLSALIWDCSLANQAQEWATLGKAEHREDTYHGENIFVSTNASERVSTVVKTWLNEKANWDNRTASCAAGKVCTHYTQVMWRLTARMGCGVLREGSGKWKTLLVCNYDPAGNTGGRPF